MVKCLLIVPNPESALNEEAGKLLLEAYDDYYARAKMMTEIHAQVSLSLGLTGDVAHVNMPQKLEGIDPFCLLLNT